MDNNNFVSFKVYLIRRGSNEPEIRRFGLQGSVVSCYNLFVARITEIFPKLCDQVFTVYWKDEEEDEIAISSDEELIIALKSIKSELKTFYVKVQSPLNGSAEKENDVLHPGVYCDGCSCNIVGFRFKCLECNNYDLCSLCERTGVHSEHSMLRLANLLGHDHIRKLRKIANDIQQASSMFIEVKQPRRKHSHDGRSEFGRKKKRCDKRESGAETGDESEDGYHKKCRKLRKCGYKKASADKDEKEKGFTNRFCLVGPYTQVMNDVLKYLSPAQFQPRQHCEATGDATEKSQEDPFHVSYLRSVGLSLQKLLDPLGVDVDFEVRSKNEKPEEQKKEEKKGEQHKEGKKGEQKREGRKGEQKKEEKKGEQKKEEKKGEQKNEEQLPESTPSVQPQKEVRFTSSEQIKNEMKQKIDEITKMLDNQTMNRSSSADNDGWVSFEELKKISEEPQRSPSAEVIPKESDLEKKEKEPEITVEHLYPDIRSNYVSPNPKVNLALDKMLAMGFTNEKNWLTFLLEAKDGNIDDALEVLSFQKKN